MLLTPASVRRAFARPRRHRLWSSTGFWVKALDAAQPFDFESRAAQRIRTQKKLKVGIVGFGTFGQFLAKRIAKNGHEVIAVSRGDYAETARKLGVQFHHDSDDFAEQHPDAVVLATSILSLRDVVSRFPFQRLRRSTLVVDVLSVKVFPKQLLLEALPPTMDLLCTHPMFGPDSGKHSWQGLNFMFEKVRVGTGTSRVNRVETLLQIFRDEGCHMVDMSCEEHDLAAANTQFITHTVGRVLEEMKLQSTGIDTRGYEMLLNLVDNTANDSYDLYYGLFMYNQNSTETLDRLDRAFDSVKRRLFSELHDKVRQQIFIGDGKPQKPVVQAVVESQDEPAADVSVQAQTNDSS